MTKSFYFHPLSYLDMDCEAVGGVGSSEFVQVGESEGGGLGGEPQTLKPSHTLVPACLPLTKREIRGLGLRAQRSAADPQNQSQLVPPSLPLTWGLRCSTNPQGSPCREGLGVGRSVPDPMDP